MMFAEFYELLPVVEGGEDSFYPLFRLRSRVANFHEELAVICKRYIHIFMLMSHGEGSRE